MANRYGQPEISRWRVFNWWSAANIVLGLWLIWSPSALGDHAPQLWINAFVMGTLVAVLAATRTFRLSASAVSWLNLVIGLWMIASPWLFGESGSAALWGTGITGLAIAGFACASAGIGRQLFRARTPAAVSQTSAPKRTSIKIARSTDDAENVIYRRRAG